MYKRQDYNEEVSFNTALLEIEDILNVHNLSCQELGSPVPTYSQRTDEANAIDPIEQISQLAQRCVFLPGPR